MNYSVTGTARHALTPKAKRIIRDKIASLTDVTTFTTGGARHVDTYAAQVARELHPRARHVVVLPAKPYDSFWITTEATMHYEIVKMPSGTDEMDRNDELVRRCDVMLAFPAQAAEVLRSGTWATIRRTRKAGKLLDMNPLYS